MFYSLYTLAKHHVTLASLCLNNKDILDTREHWLDLRQYFGYTKAIL